MGPRFLILRTRPRPSLFPRLRPRRHKSSAQSNPEPTPGNDASSIPSDLPRQSHSQPANPSSQSSQSASPASLSPPSSVPAPSGSRSLREIIQAGPVGRLGRSYSRIQDRRPYATQVCSSLVVYLCGDLSAQLLFPSDSSSQKSQEGPESGNKNDDKTTTGEGRGGYDPWRTLRHLTVGVGSSIPSYNWFMFLHHNFNFASKFLSILTKVAVQQAVFTPVFNTYFFSVHSLLSGASLEETFERLKVALPISIVNSCKLWPAVTAFSFMYVSPQFRSVFSGVIAVGWQTYLSWLNQKAAREVEAELAETASLQVNVPASAVTLKA